MSNDMLFEWDPAKAAANLRKHGVAFEDAIRVFADPACVSDVERIERSTFLRHRRSSATEACNSLHFVLYPFSTLTRRTRHGEGG
jgi:uncharacterized DUF497 family protein